MSNDFSSRSSHTDCDRRMSNRHLTVFWRRAYARFSNASSTEGIPL